MERGSSSPIRLEAASLSGRPPTSRLWAPCRQPRTAGSRVPPATEPISGRPNTSPASSSASEGDFPGRLSLLGPSAAEGVRFAWRGFPMRNHGSFRRFSVLLLLFSVLALSGISTSLPGVCGPFTDVADPAFCPFILQVFTTVIPTGTTTTTYDPSASVTRIQMAAFLSRTVDRTLQRGSRRAALGQFWSTRATGLTLTTVGAIPTFLRSDGLDVWVSNNGDETVMRLRGSDGRVLETWTSTLPTGAVLAAMGQSSSAASTIPGASFSWTRGNPPVPF